MFLKCEVNEKTYFITWRKNLLAPMRKNEFTKYGEDMGMV